VAEGSAWPFDLLIVGLGITSVRQHTREVEAAIRRAREVLHVSAGYGTHAYLQTLCAQVTDLGAAVYQPNLARLELFDRMSARVLEAALDYPPVVFAVHGHPLVYVYPSQQLLRASEILGLRTTVLPGISAFDSLCVDLRLDPGMQGLQMYEATELLLRQRPLQPDVPCFVWQVGAVESSLHTEATSSPARFTRIKQYLLRFYPPWHVVTAVYSSVHPLLPSELLSFRLGDIEAQHSQLHAAFTLYIPPLAVRPVVDTTLLEQLDDVAHLRTITEPS
jgi:hypothetical protein